MAKPGTHIDWLARYQPWRRTVEVGFWVAILAIEVGFNSVVTWMDARRSGDPIPYWQPLMWEVSSVLVIGPLIVAIVLFERRFPVRCDTLPQCIGWHVLASVVFCVVHVVGMFVLRLGIYSAVGQHYQFDDWTQQFVYEYLKDVRAYITILATILGYRLLMLRAQGEARVLDAPEPPHLPAGDPVPEPAPASRPERFLVRKLRKEFLIAAGDIDWLQAQGNYVGLRVNGHDYLLRSTLADFLDQLDPARFVRVHRSHAVNLDRIAEIEPIESGDARLKMKDGSVVPCSRRYRDALGAGTR